MWEVEGDEGVVIAELTADGDGTVLVTERRGIALDLTWAYGAGWQEHLTDCSRESGGFLVRQRIGRVDEGTVDLS